LGPFWWKISHEVFFSRIWGFFWKPYFLKKKPQKITSENLHPFFEGHPLFGCRSCTIGREIGFLEADPRKIYFWEDSLRAIFLLLKWREQKDGKLFEFEAASKVEVIIWDANFESDKIFWPSFSDLEGLKWKILVSINSEWNYKSALSFKFVWRKRRF